MLNNIRNFSKTMFAKILIAIIIVPFVFWGMGSVFSGGNTNNIAKINNESISTQDFIDYLNSLQIENSYIKENIDKNIIEETLSNLISKNMLALEVKNLNLNVSDKVLNKIIKNNKNFIDEDNKFSRVKYEKFLLSANLTAPQFEYKLRQDELKKKLFNYISGGIKSPLFMTNNTFKEKTKQITIKYINLEKTYKNRDKFSKKEIIDFVEKNKNELKERVISFKYAKITPIELIGDNNFNEQFFKIIDEIENSIAEGANIKQIESKLNIKTLTKENYNINEETINKNDENNNIYKKIFERSKNNIIEILDQNDYFLIYEVYNDEKKVPKLNNLNFKDRIVNLLYNQEKFRINKKLIKDISEKIFSQNEFNDISKKNNVDIKTMDIDSIFDNKKFTTESIKFLYTLNKDNYTLISDEFGNIYLINVVKILEKNISKNTIKFINYVNESNVKIRNEIYSSYDVYLNSKYKIKVNQKTLDRVKNYFK